MVKYINYPFYNFHAIKAAYINASDICNFQCKICKLPRTKKKSFVPLEALKDRVKEAAGLGLYNLIFIGQEVILHPNIDEIIKFSFDKAGANYITFNTNGLGFTNNLVWQKLASVKRYLGKVYIAVSVNFYNQETFSDWSGHKGEVLEQWCKGFRKAINSWLNISSIDIILKKDTDIVKILDFLAKITNKKNDYPEGIRIIDLMPFGYTRGQIYRKLKYKLTETDKEISKILKKYPGKVHFEGFPICIFNQKDLKDEKYFIYNFYLSFKNGILTQYDPSIYETYYSGPTENREINQKELFNAYDKMFCYLAECRNCYYKDKCYGIQKEYLKFYPRQEINKEIKLLKSINWK